MKEEKLKKQNDGCQQPKTKHQTPKGITLVALVITVIILLILAGVAMSMIAGQDGLFSRAENAATKYNEAAQNEAEDLKEIIHELNKINANFKLSATDIKCREFTINVEIEGITEEITEIEYFVNGESIGKTTENTFLVENLEPETDYSVHIKAYNQDGNYYESGKTTIRTADKVYLVKDGQATITFTLARASINSSYTDRIRVTSNSTAYRAGIFHVDGLDVTPYKALYCDLELLWKPSIATFACAVWDMSKTPWTAGQSHLAQVVFGEIGVTSAARTTRYIDLSKINQNVKIGIVKSDTSGSSTGSVSFDIYNLWLEI